MAGEPETRPAARGEVRPGEVLGCAAFLAAAQDPPPEYGPMPFWFLNDDLDLGELLRQLHALHQGGMGGVVLHPRIGLSRRVGYLTAEYFRLVAAVVDECAALGMKVILYDEASYPSGSACGAVAAENPAFAARALVAVRREIEGPWRGYWRPSAGRSLDQRVVSVVLAPAAPAEPGRPAGRGAVASAADGGPAIDATRLLPLLPDERGLCCIDVGPGPWHALACIDVASGGHIRGAFPEQEDGSASAPPAGDLMNPQAVAAFLRLTHDAYAKALEGRLGSTVVAVFTDEPNPLGRGARRGAQPYTAGLEADLARRVGRPPAEVRAWLPALWADYGPETTAFRKAYAETVQARIREVFYRAQADWCAAHGLALTGHPADSDDMASLRDFTWPGQDMVWRWVLPGNGTALQGANSVAPKAATSAARAAGRRRVAAELFGAYGWRLTLDEAKWLLDWHFARGVNLMLPHACFYSLRGGRAYESEPDVGPHNPWWRHFQTLMRYARRLSWLLTDGEHVCDLAVLGDGARLPWAPARPLHEAQRDFLYVDWDALCRARVEGATLRAGTQAYRAAVLDPGDPVPPEARAILARWRARGGWIGSAEELLRAADGRAPAADVRVAPAAPDLRAVHVRKRGLDAYLLFHEGEAEIDTSLHVATAGAAMWWDPLRGTADEAGPAPWDLRLPRRECRVLLVEPGRAAEPGPAPRCEAGGSDVAIEAWEGRPLGDWTRTPAMERFAGTVRYTARVRMEGTPERALLDLGAVGDAAEVTVNGVGAGTAAWAPYAVETPAALWRPGENTLDIDVTNSAANAFEGAMLPSGLMGPVRLRVWTR